MGLEKDVLDALGALSLRRRLLLHEFNKDLRNTLAKFLIEWMSLNEEVEEIGIEIVEDYDEEGNGWSGLEIHIHSEDEDQQEKLQDKFLEFLKMNVLDANFEMIASAMSEPLWVRRVKENGEELDGDGDED